MKKSVVLILGLLISSVILSTLVLAQDSGTSSIVTSIGGIITSIYDSGVKPLAGFLIGKESAGDAKNFFTLVLILVLLVSVLWEIIEKVPILNQNSWVKFIVAFGIALISVRFLGEAANSAWFKTVLLPSQTLGIALMCLIPFVIYFFFVMDVGNSSPTLAKILWIFGAVLFAVLYFTRVDEIGTKDAGKFNPANIYLLTAGVSLLFLIFDGTIRKLRKKIIMEKSGAATTTQAELEIRRRLAALPKDIENGVIDESEAEKLRKDYKKKLAYLAKV